MTKINQHYVPKCLLRGFTIPGEKSLVWEYDKSIGKISEQPRSINKICARSKYYAQETSEGEEDVETVENQIQIVEDKTARIIRAIHQDTGREYINISPENRGILSFFIGLQLMRVPSFRDGVKETLEAMLRITANRIIDKQRKEGSIPQIVDECIRDSGLRIDVKEWASLRVMVGNAEQVALSMLYKYWEILVAPKQIGFITSDNPVLFGPWKKIPGLKTMGCGPAHPCSIVHVPLSRDVVIEIKPILEKGTSGGIVSHEQQEKYLLTKMTSANVKAINRHIGWSATRYVYAPEKSLKLAEMLYKFRNNSQRFSCC